MLCFINKPRNPCSTIINAPDKVHVFTRLKAVPVPVSFKTQNDFFYFMQVSRNDGIITCFSQVFCFQFRDFINAIRSSITIDFS